MEKKEKQGVWIKGNWYPSKPPKLTKEEMYFKIKEIYQELHKKKREVLSLAQTYKNLHKEYFEL